MYSSAEAYSLAYKAHYNRKDYNEALRLYLVVIRDYPDSNEARYASQQLQNLKKQIDFNSISFDEPRLNQVLKAFIERNAEKEKQLDQQAAAKAAFDETYRKNKEATEQLRKNMQLTTCSSLEGYRVTEQHGLVFGECLFKMGFLKQLDAGLSDIASILSFGNQELSGTTELLDTAREYAIRKMISKAADLGANAIVGIDSESSMGSSIMHITIYGTAVNVERLEQAESE